MLLPDIVLGAFTQLKQLVIIVISSIYLVQDPVLLLYINSVISHKNLTMEKLLSPLSDDETDREREREKIGFPAPLQLKIYGIRKIINQFLKKIFKSYGTRIQVQARSL